MSIRRPVWVLHVLVVGLALHNLVMSQLWRAGVRGSALSVLAAWKDVLLAGALVAVFAGLRGRPLRPTVCDWLALAFAGFVVVYALIPQSTLGGGATHSGVLYAARHDLLPVEAYLLGRGLALTVEEQRSLVRTVLFTAAGVATVGLLDVYLVPLSFWRHAAGWYEHQLGLVYHGLSGLPENFVYNAGNNVVFRRLTSTFLSPLATAYLLVIALLLMSLRRRTSTLLALLLFAALLWTHTRAGLAALIVGLLVLAVLRRALAPAVVAVIVAVVGIAFVKGYTHFGPRTHFTASELRYQEHHAQANPGASHDATSANEASTREHLAEPQGRPAHRLPPSVRIRARQRGRDGCANEGDGRGRRVDVHRARCRDRHRRGTALRRVVARAAVASLRRACDRGGVRSDAVSRLADRRDRRPVARSRRLGARGLGRLPRFRSRSESGRSVTSSSILA